MVTVSSVVGTLVIDVINILSVVVRALVVVTSAIDTIRHNIKSF